MHTTRSCFQATAFLFFDREEQFWWFCKWLLDCTHTCRIASVNFDARFPTATFYGFFQRDLNEYFDNFVRHERSVIATIRGVTA